MNSSIRSIFKTTALFGSVQIWKILFAALRTKLAALLIGSAGLGVLGIYNSIIGLFVSLTNLGIDRSGVQAIAASAETQPKIISVLRRLSVYTGTTGMILFMVLSKFLSDISFGDSSYSVSLVFLSVTILFNQLHSINLSIIRARREIQTFAKLNLFIAFINSLLFILVFYTIGVKGIPLGIVVVSFSSLLLSYWYVRDKKSWTIRLTKEEFIDISNPVIKLGIVLSLGGFIASLSNYVIRVFIVNSAGIEIAGYYDSGFTLIATYFGFVFTGLTTDYYPRLSALSNDLKSRNNLMNEQSMVSIILVLPLVILLLLNLDTVVQLLYTKEFVVVKTYVNIAVVGVYFKTLSYSIGVLLVSLADRKLIFATELVSNIFLVVVTFFLVDSMPLIGPAIGYAVSQGIMLLMNLYFAYRSYSFRYTRELVYLLIIGTVIITFVVLCVVILEPSFLVSALFSLVVLFISLYYINSKTKYIKF